jgi:hypothetical protein
MNVRTRAALLFLRTCDVLLRPLELRTDVTRLRAGDPDDLAARISGAEERAKRKAQLDAHKLAQ